MLPECNSHPTALSSLRPGEDRDLRFADGFALAQAKTRESKDQGKQRPGKAKTRDETDKINKCNPPLGWCACN